MPRGTFFLLGNVKATLGQAPVQTLPSMELGGRINREREGPPLGARGSRRKWAGGEDLRYNVLQMCLALDQLA